MAENETAQPHEDQPLLSSGASSVNKVPKELDDSENESWKFLIGLAYMCAMGVCGVVLTAIGSTLDSVAEQCGTTALKVSTVFLARGAGAMLGSFSGGKLYSIWHGNYVMVCALIWISTTLMLLAWCYSVWYLHVLFAALGFGTAVTDTGCQIMTRKAHGKMAGPWLGANTVAFGIAGALVPFMELFTSSLIIQFAILASVAVGTALLVMSVPVPDYLGKSMDKALAAESKDGKSMGRPNTVTAYAVEILFGCSVFCLIGGKVTFSSYIEDYVEDENGIKDSNKALALAALWSAITFGRLFGLWDQVTLNKRGQDERAARERGLPPPHGKSALDQLYSHIDLWLGTGALGCLLMLIWPSSSLAIWVGIILYGFGNGPCVGYCYDMNNRITVPSEFGMSIVMFGLNFGASLVPYLVVLAWDDTGKAYFLPLITLFTMVLPIGFVAMTRRFQQTEMSTRTFGGSTGGSSDEAA